MAGSYSGLLSYAKLSFLIVSAYLFTLYLILKCIPLYSQDEPGVFVTVRRGSNQTGMVATDSKSFSYQLKSLKDKESFFKKIVKTKSEENKEVVDFEDIGEETADCLSTENFNRFRKIHENVFTYSAFYDTRTGQPFIRILAIVRRNFSVPRGDPFWCHFPIYDEHSEVSYVSTKLGFYELCENHKRLYGGWILSCGIPPSMQAVPDEVLVGHGETTGESVSRSKRICVKSRSKNVTRKTLQFGVCVPPLYGDIKPKDLIEFVEFNRILGGNVFTFYTQESMDKVSSEIEAVLRYYESRNIINIVRWHLPVSLKHIWYHGQSLAINDCLYRNMFDFEYLIFVDIDEFLVPRVNLTNWSDVIDTIAKTDHVKFRNASGLIFKSTLFSGEFSRSVFTEEMKVNVLTNRTKGFSFYRNKVIVKPARIFEMGIHHISRSWPDSDHYGVIKVKTDIAHVHHYRKCVSEFGTHCEAWTEDLTVPVKYGMELVNRYLRTVYDITP